jgi:hypothetical protein
MAKNVYAYKDKYPYKNKKTERNCSVFLIQISTTPTGTAGFFFFKALTALLVDP